MNLREIGTPALVAVTAVLTGCVAEPPVPAPRATRYYVFADASESIGAAQASRWSDAAATLVFNQLQPGDAVVVYAVTDHTDESAPVFDREIPAADPDAGLDVDLAARRALATARAGGLDAVTRALRSPVRARETRLLDALRRIGVDASRDTRAVFLTDGLESAPGLDLETTPLTDDNLLPILDVQSRRRSWARGMLRGVKVQFVLDSPEINQRRRVNGHQRLERFWRTVVESLDAELVAFDSRIAGGQY
jgi:hypothetical protein